MFDLQESGVLPTKLCQWIKCSIVHVWLKKLQGGKRGGEGDKKERYGGPILKSWSLIIIAKWGQKYNITLIQTVQTLLKFFSSTQSIVSSLDIATDFTSKGKLPYT